MMFFEFLLNNTENAPFSPNNPLLILTLLKSFILFFTSVNVFPNIESSLFFVLNIVLFLMLWRHLLIVISLCYNLTHRR